MKVLLDTNILLDVLAERQPFLAASETVWRLMEQHQVTALVSTLSVANIYYIARKEFGRERAMMALQKIVEVFEIAPVDAEDVSHAMKGAMLDFEDALQAFCGHRAGATHVVTRDVKGFAGGPLAVLTPEEFPKLLSPTGQTPQKG